MQTRIRIRIHKRENIMIIFNALTQQDCGDHAPHLHGWLLSNFSMAVKPVELRSNGQI